MTRRHVEAIIEACHADRIADLTRPGVLRAIDGIRQAGNKRVKDEASQRQQIACEPPIPTCVRSKVSPDGCGGEERDG